MMWDIHAAISHHNFGTYHTTIKHVYKYPEAMLRLQSVSPSNFLSLGGGQERTSMQPYHINTYPVPICWALEAGREGPLYQSFTGRDIHEIISHHNCVSYVTSIKPFLKLY